MPDPRALPADPIEDLRRTVLRRQTRRRRAIVAVIGGAVVLVATAFVWKAPVLLVWNASASAPPGLYRVNPRAAIRRGDMVVARMPKAIRQLAARRHYLPATVLVVKRVAAVAGDEVCAAGPLILINGLPVAERQRSDGAGRPMPGWEGCRRLGRGDTLLLMDSPHSFDGRYFGVTRQEDIVGRAALLWAR